MAYSTDWLASAHVIIALVFFGFYRNPIHNTWVLQFRLVVYVFYSPDVNSGYGAVNPV